MQRVTAAYIADHRRQRQQRLALGPYGAMIEPLDTIGWTSARYGYAAKPFEVSRITDNLMTLNQGLHLREVHFSWSSEDLLPVARPAIVTTPPGPQAMPGFAVAAGVLADATAAARRPAIDLTLAAATDALNVLWEVRLPSEAAASLTGSHNDIRSGQLRLIAGVLPATA